jgi:hypothetical protein
LTAALGSFSPLYLSACWVANLERESEELEIELQP